MPTAKKMTCRDLALTAALIAQAGGASGAAAARRDDGGAARLRCDADGRLDRHTFGNRFETSRLQRQSGGGAVTLFSAALDTQIKTAFVSVYLNAFRDCITSVSHSIDSYIPGILNWGEMYDVAGPIAPRPFFPESGERDPNFPLKGFLEDVPQVQSRFEVFGSKEQTGHEVHCGGA